MLQLQCLLLPSWGRSYAFGLDYPTLSFVLQLAGMVFITSLIWSCLCLYIVSIFTRPGTHYHETWEQCKMATVTWQQKAIKRLESYVCHSVLTKRNHMCFAFSDLQLKAPSVKEKKRERKNKSLFHKTTSSNPSSHTPIYSPEKDNHGEYHKFTQNNFCVEKELSNHPL